MTNWPRYRSHKIIQAARIVELIYEKPAIGNVVSVIVQPDGGEPEEFTPSHAGMLREAQVGGYAMLYPDGFRSISPAKAFEEGYTVVQEDPDGESK